MELGMEIIGDALRQVNEKIEERILVAAIVTDKKYPSFFKK
jgi:hypothetical protein